MKRLFSLVALVAALHSGCASSPQMVKKGTVNEGPYAGLAYEVRENDSMRAVRVFRKQVTMFGEYVNIEGVDQGKDGSFESIHVDARGKDRSRNLSDAYVGQQLQAIVQKSSTGNE